MDEDPAVPMMMRHLAWEKLDSEGREEGEDEGTKGSRRVQKHKR